MGNIRDFKVGDVVRFTAGPDNITPAYSSINRILSMTKNTITLKTLDSYNANEVGLVEKRTFSSLVEDGWELDRETIFCNLVDEYYKTA